MDIYVLDGINGVSDIVDTFESVIWNMQFFGANDFELVVAGTPENINKLAIDKLLVRDVDMSNGVYKNVMMIENRELTFDIDKGWILKVSGGGLKKILGRRVVWTQTNITGKVETGIRQVITENVISPTISARAIANFTLDSEQGYTDTMDIQLFGENIAEWLESCGKTYGIGWDIYIDNGNYVFTLKKGVDRTYNQNEVTPVIFSPEYDNLISSTYRFNRSTYKNAAIVGGEGEGTDQRTASVGTASGLERFETYVDGSTVSSNGDIITAATYIKMLQDYGTEQLAGTAYTENIEGQVIANGMYNLNEDYFLGDIVQIVNINDISATSRIIELIYSEDENGHSLIPTFSDWSESEV